MILLSSESRKQYLEDIIRVLAAPKGAIIQFRYDNRWIKPTIVTKIKHNELVGESVCVVFIDQGDFSSVQYVPCRFGTIVETQEHGNYSIVKFFVGDYSQARDIVAFTKFLKDDKQTPKKEEKLIGYYWFDSPDNYESKIVKDSSPNKWESIVNQLLTHKCFDGYLFYQVLGIFDKRNNAIEFKHDRFVLEEDREYSLSIAHTGYATDNVVSLCVKPSTNALMAITNNCRLIDSPYDIKSYSLYADKIKFDQHCYIEVSCDFKNDKNNQCEINIPIKIQAGTKRKLIIGLILGFLLSCSAVIIKEGTAEAPIPLFDAIFTIQNLFKVIGSFAAGIAASFNLGK